MVIRVRLLLSSSLFLSSIPIYLYSKLLLPLQKMSLEQISSHALLKNDEQLKGIDFEKYSHPVSETVIETTKKALESKNHKVTVVTDKHAALEELKKLIPSGVTVAQAGSTSLIEIGWDKWSTGSDVHFRNLHAELFKEIDQAKRGEMRRQGMTADYFVSSVTAISQTGEIFACDLTTTRIGGFTAAKNVILIVGAQKIVPTASDGLARQSNYCLPMESARVRIVYKFPASAINNAITVHGSIVPGRFHVIIVKEALGY